MVSLPTLHISWSNNQPTPRDRQGIYGNRRYEQVQDFNETPFQEAEAHPGESDSRVLAHHVKIKHGLRPQEDLADQSYVPITLNLFHSGRELTLNFTLLCLSSVLALVVLYLLYSLHHCFKVTLYYGLVHEESVLGWGLIWAAVFCFPCAFLPPAKHVRLKVPVACCGILMFAMSHFIDWPLLYISLSAILGLSISLALDAWFSYLLALIMYFIPFSDPRALPKFLVRYFYAINTSQLLVGSLFTLSTHLSPYLTVNSNTSHVYYYWKDENTTISPDNLLCMTLDSHMPTMAFLFTISILLFASSILSIILQPMALEERQDPLERSKLRQILHNIGALFREKDPLLLFPISLAIGLQDGFVWSELYQSYILCQLGIFHFGYVIIFMGTFKIMSCFTVVHVIEAMPRLAVIFAGLTFHAGIILTLGIWRPSSDDILLFYVISGGIAICNSIWEVVIITRLAFIHTNRWRHTYLFTTAFKIFGAGVLLVLGSILTTMDKLYILTTMIIISVVSLGYLEVKQT